MKIIDFSKQKSIINKYVRELRDKDIQRDRLRFRQNVIRIGHAMAYEVSKVLEYGEVELDTPLAKAKAIVPSEDIVIATVFRAGLPLHQGFLDVFDDAGNAFVSAYRYYKDKEGTEVGIRIEYMATPCLEGKTLILVDPMLATGGSSCDALSMLKERGCNNIRLMCLVAAPEGIARVQREHPDVDIYVASVDECLNKDAYIVPGLGDAGDRIFGTK